MKKVKLLKRCLFVLALIGFLFLLAASIVLFLAMKPKYDAQKFAVQTAKKQTDLVHIANFQLYHGKETYYSVFGTAESGTEEVVAVSKKGRKIYTYRLNDGISQRQARQIAYENGAKKIKKVTFGIFDDFPIWEITAENGYYLINFETGDFLKRN